MNAMTETDKALMSIYDELQTLRCLKQIELGLAVSNSKIESISELESITDMIANPKKYFVKDGTNEEDDLS
jgi:hypothetical protein